jgi:F-type H+-transporting ATPase subunit gamma
MYGHLLATAENIAHPFLEKRSEAGKAALCLITSDTGLCGSYNHNIISLAEKFLEEKGRGRLAFVFVGKKGFNFFRKRGVEFLNAYVGLNGKYSPLIADEIAGKLMKDFESGVVDEVYVAHTHFETAFRNKPTIKKILNLERKITQEEDFILEPDREGILERFLPYYLLQDFRVMLLESFISEHACRVIAMRSATDNAKEMLDSLTLIRNKTRQANITQDMIEVISTVEALRG